MQIKKYIAQTLKEASEMMKEELGEEAIVLSTRVVNSGSPKGPKKLFELTAGIEDSYEKVSKHNSDSNKEPESKDFATELKKLNEKIFIAPKQEIPQSEKVVSKNIAFKDDKKQLLSSIKEIADLLIQREVQKSLVNTIIDQLKKYSEILTTSNLDSYVVSTMASMIPTSNFEIKKKNRTKVISLIGPTGVGKTTCIAKLAVISKILHNLDIGLISIDTYRLGAIDQLKIFSEVSNIDFLVAYDPKELQEHMNKFKKKDIIFVDTAGRSQNNQASLSSMKKFLELIKADDTYLVLSSTSTTKTMIDVADKFSLFNYNGIVFTKLDEAVSYGNIMNVVTKFNIPIKYLTNGQIIPDDIIAADPEFIANMILTGKISK